MHIKAFLSCLRLVIFCLESHQMSQQLKCQLHSTSLISIQSILRLTTQQKFRVSRLPKLLLGLQALNVIIRLLMLIED
ncbi:hypothetical protein FGO68_gene16657 [Halteria grandinella]|uniref:Uncharacterized protein n=1 Tax=Halteria grandinella TaxID=5974 RepID=A0A8J8NA29_HALGN|nr:hypothetical protein FGO68_gene16657 [Halteria grandinella]